MRRTTCLGAAGVLALLAAALAAHDLWIEPGSFRPKPGETVTVALSVGEDWKGEPVARNVPRIVRFWAEGPGGEIPVLGTHGSVPAGSFQVDKPGLYVVAYRSNNAYLEQPAAEFEAHLRKEGLAAFVAERARRGESAKPSRELYSRAVKSVLAAGGDSLGRLDRPLGLTLELVAETDPYRTPPGGELVVRLLYLGEPLAGAQVEAIPAAASESKQVARSDAQGRVRFRLVRKGAWLVKALHMRRAEDPAEGDWESVWASLTFELP
jgi:uncharacterized GH25 family protein